MNREDMILSIKTLLGYPQIDVEISDDQIKACIDEAVLLAKDHIQPRRYRSYTVMRINDIVIPSYTNYVDLSDLDFEVITDVYRGDFLSPYIVNNFYLQNYATRGVPEAFALGINLRSNMEALLNRSWKVIGNKLYLDKYYAGVTVEFIPKIVELEDVDDAYWISWIKRYAIAEAKGVLSRLRGKFVIDSNPFKTDADTLATQSAEEKAALLTEIENRGYFEIMR